MTKAFRRSRRIRSGRARSDSAWGTEGTTLVTRRSRRPPEQRWSSLPRVSVVETPPRPMVPEGSPMVPMMRPTPVTPWQTRSPPEPGEQPGPVHPRTGLAAVRTAAALAGAGAGEDAAQPERASADAREPVTSESPDPEPAVSTPEAREAAAAQDSTGPDAPGPGHGGDEPPQNDGRPPAEGRLSTPPTETGTVDVGPAGSGPSTAPVAGPELSSDAQPDAPSASGTAGAVDPDAGSRPEAACG